MPCFQAHSPLLWTEHYHTDLDLANDTTFEQYCGAVAENPTVAFYIINIVWMLLHYWEKIFVYIMTLSHMQPVHI